MPQSPDYSSYTKRIKSETKESIAKDALADRTAAKEARSMAKSSSGNKRRAESYMGQSKVYDKMATKKERSLFGF